MHSSTPLEPSLFELNLQYFITINAQSRPGYHDNPLLKVSTARLSTILPPKRNP